MVDVDSHVCGGGLVGENVVDVNQEEVVHVVHYDTIRGYCVGYNTQQYQVLVLGTVILVPAEDINIWV